MESRRIFPKGQVLGKVTAEQYLLQKTLEKSSAKLAGSGARDFQPECQSVNADQQQPKENRLLKTSYIFDSSLTKTFPLSDFLYAAVGAGIGLGKSLAQETGCSFHNEQGFN